MEKINEESPTTTVVNILSPIPPVSLGHKMETAKTLSFVEVKVPTSESQARILASYGSQHLHLVDHLQLAALSVEDAVSLCIQSKSWHVLANYCQFQLTNQTQNSQEFIESLWFLRTLATVNLRQPQVALAELSALKNITLFELKAIKALLPSFSDRVNESIEELYELLSTEQSTDNQLTLRILISGILCRAMDFYNAERVLLPISKGNVHILSCLGRLQIRLGNMEKSKQYFGMVEKLLNEIDTLPDNETFKHDLLMLNRSLIAVGTGDWQSALTILTTLIAANPQNYVAINNLAISMIYTGKLQESIALLQSIALTDKASPMNVSEPILFNLTTLFELATETNQTSKMRIVSNLAKYGGDAFNYDKLKL